GAGAERRERLHPRAARRAALGTPGLAGRLAHEAAQPRVLVRATERTPHPLAAPVAAAAPAAQAPRAVEAPRFRQRRPRAADRTPGLSVIEGAGAPGHLGAAALEPGVCRERQDGAQRLARQPGRV